MADIQQWRRIIQPTRVRTPAPQPIPALDLEELDDLQPLTPKRRLKPKLSAYFNQTSKSATFAEEDLPGSQFPKWPFHQTYPDPKPEEEMDAVMCHLMVEPYRPLGVHFNASLMRIFENYLTLKNERVRLSERCSEATATAQSVIAKSSIAEKDWEDERSDYKEEVKRLEVLLSKASRRGLAEVTLARQESKLHARRSGGVQKETIFEFLEKSAKLHENDKTWSNQRATMKPLLQPSSNQDMTLSKQLSQKKSMTNIHADLPFGTPPMKDTHFSLAKISLLDQHTAIRRRKRPNNGSNTTDDASSAFSCTGDLLPDESRTNTTQTGDISDIQDMVYVETMARQRGIAPSHVMPQPLDLFGANCNGNASRTCSMPNTLVTSTEQQHSASSQAHASTSIIKRANVMTRASDFFQKLRPQLAVDPAATPLASFRRFSFEPGDDVAAQQIATPGFVISPGGHTVLRKSASLCSMSSRTPSRIPTPVHNPGTIVRPRRERDKSSSSLLTIIKRSEDGNSRTSSAHSSPSVKREGFSKTSPCKERGSISGLSMRKRNRLLNHTNDLRSGGSRDAGTTAKHSSARGILESCEICPDGNYTQQENVHPAD